MLKSAEVNPATRTPSASSQTGCVVHASIAPAVTVVTLGAAVVRRRTT
jgi:hypothetical protein